MILGSYEWRINEIYVELRLINPEIEGQRRIERMERSFRLIPEDALLMLANEMTNSFVNFTENNLKESEANLAFERNSGRRLKFTFRQGCQIVFFLKFRFFHNRNSHFLNYRSPI